MDAALPSHVPPAFDAPHPLDAWRIANHLTVAELALRIETSDVAAGRYCRGRIPQPRPMANIVRETHGEVTPNHIYQWAWMKAGIQPDPPMRLSGGGA